MRTIIYKNGVVIRDSWMDSDFLHLVSIHSSEFHIEQINDDGTVKNSAKGEFIGTGIKPMADFNEEFEKAWSVLESNMAHHLHDKNEFQEAFGFTFKSTIQVSQLDNLEYRLKQIYMGSIRTDSEISCVNFKAQRIENEVFDWKKCQVSEQRDGYSRY